MNARFKEFMVAWRFSTPCSPYKPSAAPHWNGINEIISLKSKKNVTNISLKVGGHLTSNQKLIAESFNEYFTQIAEKIKSRLPPTNRSFRNYLSAPCRRSFFFSPTTPGEVQKIIRSLDDKKATGLYSIPHQLLNAIPLRIATILSDIINISFKTGKFIDALKYVKVIPVYKNKGSPFEAGNYRPISLLSNVDKILEKLVHKRMIKFLEDNKILYDRQFGFRCKHSTVYGLITITEDIKKSIDDGKLTCGVFIDLQKAFDTVDICYCKHGVPQGSVLGPILFLIYINDLANATIYSRSFNFADNTAILYTDDDPKRLKKRVNIDLKLLLHWLKANKIHLDVAKTEVILFKHKQKKVNYNIRIKLDGKLMIFSKQTRYLGMLIDENLSMNSHNECISGRLRKANGALNLIRHYVPFSILRSIYYALFQPHIHMAYKYGDKICHQNHE